MSVASVPGMIVQPTSSAQVLPMVAGPYTAQFVAPGQQQLPMEAATGQAQVAAEAVKPPSTIGLVVKNLIGSAAVGAAAGAGIGWLPFVPGGALTGALVGAGIGAVLGVVRGVHKAREAKEAAQALMMGSQNMPADPAALGPELATEAVAPKKPAKKPAKVKHVVVHKGDTLASIAHKHHTTVAKIHKANKAIKDVNHISIGMKIVIPS